MNSANIDAFLCVQDSRQYEEPGAESRSSQVFHLSRVLRAFPYIFSDFGDSHSSIVELSPKFF
jgi:hypothetical protein